MIGLRHIELLEERFGTPAVLGGQCLISATLDGDGSVLHLNDSHILSFGERDGAALDRSLAIASALTGKTVESLVRCSRHRLARKS